MSEHAPELGQFGKPSLQIQIDASNWVVERHTSAGWDADSQARLDNWLSQSVLHRVAYLRFEDAWKAAYRFACPRPHPSRYRSDLKAAADDSALGSSPAHVSGRRICAHAISQSA